MEKTKVILAGLGNRGVGLLWCLEEIEEVEVVAVCDAYQPKIDRYIKDRKEKNLPQHAIYYDFKECIDSVKADAVIIATSWDKHVEHSIYAMERGVAVGCEVGGGYSVEGAWDLVKCQERTKTPFMFLENCCFGKLELLALNMKRAGVLGEIVHCEGGYRHDLRHEIIGGADGSHYRFMQYKNRNCENYPTHEIGPIAKLLDINCGNRFLSLFSMASKSRGLKEFIKMQKKEDMYDLEFNQGDVVTTLIKCANGETVKITLDTTVPRFYTRNFLVEGTKGVISEDCDAVYLESDVGRHVRKDFIGSVEKYYDEYGHKLWKNDVKKDVHGGVDHITMNAFIKALRSGEPMPVDVYDAATWMTISALSEQSIATGQAVAFPDFTNGQWAVRKNKFLIEE